MFLQFPSHNLQHSLPAVGSHLLWEPTGSKQEIAEITGVSSYYEALHVTWESTNFYTD